MRYPGGKGKCYQRLINLMPPHQTYIEPYLGGGAVMRHKKPAVKNIGIDIDPKVISRWKREFSPMCELIQGDALRFLENYPFQARELAYIDPPYIPETRWRKKVYRFDYSLDDHRRLLDLVRKLPCMVMISGYDHALYREKLSNWRLVKFSSKSHTGLREECVWLNFKEHQKLHDTRYLGDSFRERQTIQRRQERLRSKIESMDPVERHDLLSWMNKTYGSTGEIA